MWMTEWMTEWLPTRMVLFWWEWGPSSWCGYSCFLPPSSQWWWEKRKEWERQAESIHSLVPPPLFKIHSFILYMCVWTWSRACRCSQKTEEGVGSSGDCCYTWVVKHVGAGNQVWVLRMSHLQTCSSFPIRVAILIIMRTFPYTFL